MRHRFLTAVFVAIVLAALAIYFTSSDHATKAGAVALDQLPIGFLDIAQKQLPTVHFDVAWRLKNGNYEIRGSDSRGRGHEVELDAQGKVVEVD